MQSIWELETFYRKQDVIIVGAGFTGLWTAISIKEKYPKKNILIIEKNAIPIGASSRNAGFACFGSLTEIIADSEKMGWDKTLDLVKMRFEGLQKIQQFFKADEIDFELCSGFELIETNSFLSKIDEVNKKLKSITGIEKTYQINQQKLEEFGLKNSGYLIENPLEGSLHSGKLLMKLLKKCQDLGVEFLFGTNVQNISETEDEIIVETENAAIKAEKIVICTNAFTNDLLPDLEIIPARGQILLTEPIENLKLKGTFHFDEGFYYFRNLGNRILLGGARNKAFQEEETTELATTEFLQNHLEKFLKEIILPNQDFKISHRWSGIMAMGLEKSPIVKQLSPRKYCAVRLSGMGVALAPKIGEIVADLI